MPATDLIKISPKGSKELRVQACFLETDSQLICPGDAALCLAPSSHAPGKPACSSSPGLAARLLLVIHKVASATPTPEAVER